MATPKVPASRPAGLRCNMQLPERALQYRIEHNLLDDVSLGRLNITSWLYQAADGKLDVYVCPNVTIAELRTERDRIEEPLVQVGFHSEARAAQWFKEHPSLRVLAIFSERIPCWEMCGPLLDNYFNGVPWFFYYRRSSFRGEKGRIVLRIAAALRTAYQLP